MTKLFLFVLLPIYAFTQHVNYESLSDDQLQDLLKKELYDMESRGATADLILDKFVAKDNAYLLSRESYFRVLVHTEYMFDKLLATKMQNGTDEPSDFDMNKEFKKRLKQKTYQGYMDHKKTDAAKEQWENSTEDGILKLVVDTHEQYSEAEQKRYDGLIILLNRDPYFTRFQITDGQTNKVILPHTN